MFAVALLLWTAADLLDHGLCTHDHGRIGAFDQTAFRAPSCDPPAPPEFDDCFCCSHVVDVGHPFRMTLDARVTRGLVDEPLSHPHRNGASLYHPPLA